MGEVKKMGGKRDKLQRIENVLDNIDINNPHDGFFKYTLGRTEAMKEFLSLNLPGKIQKQLNFDTLNRKNESYSDLLLKKGITDLVYEIDFTENGSGYLVCLFEHKSTSEKGTILQVLEYMIKIWQDKFDDDKIPPVLPVVFYHGKENWTAAKELIELFEANIEWMIEAVPNFNLYLYTLKDVVSQLNKISAPEYEIYIRTLDIINTETQIEALEKFNDFLDFIEEQNWQSKWREALVTATAIFYISLVAKPLIEINLIKKAQQKFPERRELFMPVDNILIRKGKKEGQIEILTKQLSKKLPQENSEKIRMILKDAEDKALERLSEQIFDIDKLSEVVKILEE